MDREDSRPREHVEEAASGCRGERDAVDVLLDDQRLPPCHRERDGRLFGLAGGGLMSGGAETVATLLGRRRASSMTLAQHGLGARSLRLCGVQHAIACKGSRKLVCFLSLLLASKAPLTSGAGWSMRSRTS